MRIRSTESDEPSFHRDNLRLWLDEMIARDPETGANIKSFIEDLLVIFSDNPPHSWRFSSAKYKHPIFRLHNMKTGRGNDFLVVGDRHLIMIKKFLNEEFKNKYGRLFPNENDFYGSGIGSKYDVYQRGPDMRRKYIEAIKAMAETTDEWYIKKIIK